MTNPGFKLAKTQFDAIRATIKQPQSNPELWNLSIGLGQLASALEEELEAIHQRLRNVESDVTGMK
jgi:hypothetical protein